MAYGFYEKIIFPLGSMLKGSKSSGYYKNLIRNEFLSREEIDKRNLFQISRILRYSFDNVAFYHKNWKKIDFNPHFDFNSIVDFKKIPPLTKNQIRSNLNTLLTTENNKKLIKNYTGGSTGKPMIFYQTKDSKDWSTADIFRHYKMCGWNFGNKHAFLWGAERDAPKKRILNSLEQKLRRYIWLNAFKLNEEKLTRFIQKINKYKPKLLVGYASSLFELAKFSEEKGLKIEIPFIQSSAEKLYQFQRNKIQQVFHSEVFNRYGCREVGNIAHECNNHSRLHISEEINYLEILDKNNNVLENGVEGLVSVTNLKNFGMPLIKYQNEDLAKISNDKCNCGRSSRLLESITGRISDNILTPKGQIIHGEFFTHLFYNKQQVDQFQLIQTSLNKIEIRIVPASDYTEIEINETINEIEKAIIEWINEDINVKFKIVDKIDVSKTGKFRFTISKVWNDQIKSE